MCEAIIEDSDPEGIPSGLIYELRDGYTIDVTGTYIHPDLVNTVAMWASVKYARVVTKIMNSMNELARAQHISFAEAAKRQL